MWIEDFQNEHGETVRIIADAVSRPLVECALDRSPNHRQRSQNPPEILLIFVSDISTELQALVETHLSAVTLNILCRCHPAPITAADYGDRAAQIETWLETWIDAWFDDADAIAPLLSLCLQSSGCEVRTRHAQGLQQVLAGIGPCRWQRYAMASRDCRGDQVRRLPAIDPAILDSPSVLCLVRGPRRRRRSIFATYCAFRRCRGQGLDKLFIVMPQRYRGFELTLLYATAAHDDSVDPVKAAATERFLQRFEGDCRGELRRFARLDGATDLLASNPALALALACWPAFRRQPSRPPQDRWCGSEPYRSFVSGRTLCIEKLRAPQRAVLAWLGFPDSASCRRWLATLAPECLSIALLQQLRTVIQDPARYAKLRHTRVGSVAELAALLDPLIADQLSLSFMQSLQVPPAAGAPDWSPAAKLLRKNCTAPALFNSVADLLDWHSAQVGADTLREPVADTSERQRISSAPGLAAEGSDMAHCLGTATYERLLSAGDALFYRILKPVRATVMYQRCHGGWVLKEITGRKGRKLRPGEIVHCLQAMGSKPEPDQKH